MKRVRSYSEVFLFSDQPTSCPKCGERTTMFVHFQTQEQKEYHVCLNPNCKFDFLIECDLEEEKERQR